MKQVVFLALVPLLAAAPMTFEVASVKKSTVPPLGRCVITDGRLSHLIGIAYGVSMGMIKDSPDWVIGGVREIQ